jgi:hypothetical protein
MKIGGARLVFDSNLAHTKRMPCSYPQSGGCERVPTSLVKTFRLEALDANGNWKTAARVEENYYRLVQVPLEIETRGLRLVVEKTWGRKTARVFAFEPVEKLTIKIPAIPDGPNFCEARARIAPEDLQPPESGLESTVKHYHSA